MSTTVCPHGHVSSDPEWCDTCGARLGASPLVASAAAGAAAGAAAEPAPSASASVIACPHCGVANAVDALFCEDCGYDFTTGQAPAEPPPVPAPAGGTQSGAPDPFRRTTLPGDAASSPADDSSAPAPPGWIVIVEVDPAWFALKGTLADRPCPAASSSTIPLSQAIVHIGRSSQSRGIHPEIALDADTAVSRQHAQLIAASTSPDGDASVQPDAYAVVDLGSTNGTFLVRAGSEPTDASDPVDPGVATTLADGDRLYVGAWSRLVVRNTAV